MATILPTPTRLYTHGDTNVNLLSYLLTSANDIGGVFENPGAADRSVQVAGTFGTGTVVIEGSNDGTNFATLTDPQGNALTFVDAKIEMIEEITRFVRPRVTTPDGTTSLTVTFLIRRDEHS